MNTLDLIKKLSEESKNLPEVIAPVLSKNDIVKVFINNHPYKLNVKTDRVGWFILKSDSMTSATILREAAKFEIQKCLESVTKLRLITMRRVSESRWLAFPFNSSDAISKGITPQPLEVFLIDQNLEPFSIISARLWGKTLLYDSYVYPPDIHFSESLDKGIEEPPKISGIIPEMKIVYSMLTDEIAQAKKRTLEGRIQSAVEYLGAELVGFKEFGEGYEITYKDNTQTYKVRVSNSLRLKSAGICLSGLENYQTLSSCVAVMRQSHSRNQYFNDRDDDDEYSE
jgi:hypothetical protein